MVYTISFNCSLAGGAERSRTPVIKLSRNYLALCYLAHLKIEDYKRLIHKV